MRRWLVLAVAALVAGAAGGAGTASAVDDGGGGGRDVVLAWNEELVAALAPTPPPASGRIAAIVHGAVYDAVNGVAREHPPLHVAPAAPAGASAPAAAVEAAHTTLTSLYPARAAALDARRQATLAGLPGSSASIAAGRQWGEQVGRRYLQWRAGDGAGRVLTCPEGTAPGAWRRTSDNASACALPGLGTTPAFVVPDLDRHTVPPPPALGSAQYARELAEVVSYGSNGTAADDGTRATGHFWRPNSVVSWNVVAQQLSGERRRSLVEQARAFAVLNAAMADATRAAWRAKYGVQQPDGSFDGHYWWRPLTANEQAGDDGSALTAPVLGWRTLFPTPNHPDHPSGHATISASATASLAALYGDAPFSLTQAGQTRHYGSLSQASDEVDDSRVFAGIHFRSAVLEGQRLGRAVAADAVAALGGP